jgi:hypothetical protein
MTMSSSKRIFDESDIDNSVSANSESDNTGGSSSEERHTNTSVTNGASSDEAQTENVTTRKTRQVNGLRYFVMAALLMSAVAVSFVVYFISSNSQTEQFNTNYEGASAKIIASFETVLDKIGSVYSVGLAATVEGYDRTNQVCYVTILRTKSGKCP